MVKEFIKSLEFAAILQKGDLHKEWHSTSTFNKHFLIYQLSLIVSNNFSWFSKNGDLLHWGSDVFQDQIGEQNVRLFGIAKLQHEFANNPLAVHKETIF